MGIVKLDTDHKEEGMTFLKQLRWIWVGCFLVVTGCAGVPVLQMSKPDYPKSPLYVSALSFEKFKRPAKWESDDEWQKHVEAWQKNFKMTMGERLPEAKIFSTGVKEGLVVHPYVVDIQRNWNAMWGGLDKMSIEAELFNAATNEKVGEVSFVSDSSGVGMNGWTFGGRIGNCSENAAVLLSKSLKKR
jgi:hypothetical protein